MAGPVSRVSRVVMTGPLASFADSYALELEQRRYTPLTSVVQLRQVARLSSWLELRGLGVAELTGERVEEFLAFQRATGRWRAQWSRPGLLCLLDVLQRLGVRAVEEPVQAGSPGDALLASFERYLLTERALAAGTARGYVRHAARFLAGLPSPRPCRRDGGRRDAGRAAGVRGGFGKRDAILRRRVAGVAALLCCRGVDATSTCPGGAAGDRSATLGVASGDHCCRGPGPARELRSTLGARAARLRADHHAAAAGLAVISEPNQVALQGAGLSYILGARIPFLPDVVREWRGRPFRRGVSRSVGADPAVASHQHREGARHPRPGRVYQFRHDRARRTLRGIDEQVTKAQKAVDGKRR